MTSTSRGIHAFFGKTGDPNTQAGPRKYGSLKAIKNETARKLERGVVQAGGAPLQQMRDDKLDNPPDSGNHHSLTDGPNDSTFTSRAGSRWSAVSNLTAASFDASELRGLKRRKLSHEALINGQPTVQTGCDAEHQGKEPASVVPTTQISTDQNKQGEDEDSVVPSTEVGATPVSNTTPPSRKKTRVLRLNQNGTLGGPRETRKQKRDLSKKAVAVEEQTRGRKKKRTNLVVIIKYGVSNEERRRHVGETIEELLNVPRPTPTAKEPLSTSVQALNPSKSTHPFFTGKAALPSDSGPALGTQPATRDLAPNHSGDTNVKGFTTPGKMKHAGLAAIPKVVSLPALGRKPTLSGLHETCWPWKGLSYVAPVREAKCYHTSIVDAKNQPHDRRRKNRPETVKEGEDVLLPWTSFVHTHERVPDTLRSDCKPQRSIETRNSLQAKVLTRIHEAMTTAGPRSYDDLLQSHTAFTSAYDRIGAGLNAFDKGECESRAWTQIYAPQCAAEVLQSQHEMILLRDWLAHSTVDSVESNAGQSSNMRQCSEDALLKLKTKKRRERRAEELDGFVVSSDEDGDLKEVNTGADSLRSTMGDLKSLIRDGDGTGAHTVKRSNAILLSGPDGCGKTAAAYAVARELRFDVFEINAAGRRSGKDLLDKVGDLALNHQVRRQEAASDEVTADPLDEVIDEQQQSLTSFFNPLSKPKKGRPPKRAVSKDSKVEPKKPRAQRKQALILLEEVDLLFEDDKAFWETVLDLAQQSRRPIIMTCNDESLLPLDSLSLHAILRFKPPALELAMPYLMLVAAAENHVLDYRAVSTLYASKGMDLRASMAELDFRCQMALGDDKGGLSWYLRRWPPGCDVDSNGDLLHAVSNATFESGKDLLSRELSEGSNLLGEDLALQATNEHDIDLAELAETGLDDQCIRAPTSEHLTSSLGSASLADLSTHLDLLSAVDVMSRVDVSAQELASDSLDSSGSPLPAEAQANYTAGQPLLHATVQRDYAGFSARIRANLCIGIANHTRSQQLPHDTQVPRTSTNHIALNQELLASILEHKRRPASLTRKAIAARHTRAMSPLTAFPCPSIFPSQEEVTDVAPYARSIIAYDRALEAHRAALVEAFDDTIGDARAAKKARRKTRASRSALEGSVRASTRRERWFGKEVDYVCVMETAGRKWPRVEAELLSMERAASAEVANATGSTGPIGADDDTRASSIASGAHGV